MDAQTTGIYLTLIATLVFVTLLLVLFIISLFRHQQHRLREYKEQLRREIEVIDGERTRISADLHDELGSGLASIGLLLRQVAENHSSQRLMAACDQVFAQQKKIREISHDLVPHILESHGLAVALYDMFEEIRAAGGIELSASQHLKDMPLRASASVHIYRIIREILTNTIRHSAADKASVECVSDEKNLVIRLSDNGCGFVAANVQKGSRGNGLNNVRSRIEILGASLQFDSKPGYGTSYLIKIPLTEKLIRHASQS